MAFPRLEELEDLGGARILLRLDLNVPVREGVVLDESRIEAALPTLTWLLERCAVVAMCSHLGKPKGQVDPALSLEPVASLIEEKIGRPVIFVPACSGEKVNMAIESAVEHGVFLLENLRFNPGEKANDPDFVASLAANFTHYVNDAFGTAHRAHASVVGIPALFNTGKKAAGRLMEAELNALGSLMHAPERPFTALIGGAKVSTKTEPLEALIEKIDCLVIGGGMANTFILAEGFNVGSSLVEHDMLDTAREVMQRAVKRGVELLKPVDVVITDRIENPTDIRIVSPNEVPDGFLIADIGPDTRTLYCERIAQAQSVFWNGPMGIFEIEEFSQGTLSVAHAVADCEGFTVVGGGESVMAIHLTGIGERISHVSTGGGASLELISGKELPAVTALETS